MESGIALYSIELDGCLNGVYTNDGEKGVICNEIARIKPDTLVGVDRISGVYDCSYFEGRNSRQNTDLEITLIGKTYTFLWKDKNSKTIILPKIRTTG